MAAINEERLTRRKLEVRFPAAEWRCAVPLRLAGELARAVDDLPADERDRVVVLGISTDPKPIPPLPATGFDVPATTSAAWLNIEAGLAGSCGVWSAMRLPTTVRCRDRSPFLIAATARSKIASTQAWSPRT